MRFLLLHKRMRTAKFS